MIIKIHKAGRSFQGVCRYLTHDTDKAESAERVAWTKTLNLANDEVPAAVDEMLWTFRAADMLKRQAGIATGGSKLDKPVRHISLSWPQGEAPTQQHMTETVQAYLKFMGWADRQAVMVAHNDTRHAHVHVVINSVSPADGRALKSSHDWRRSEDFALRYEREHGQIHCEQRLRDRNERDATPTREAWQRFKKSEIAFDRAEVERLTKAPRYFERHDDKLMNSREWEALKAYQQQQREDFFVGGKEAFRGVRNAVFKEVREEFRGQWNAYYSAARSGNGKASLGAMKAALTEAQNKALDERRQVACDQLREKRDQEYQAILAQQRFDKAELTMRQQQGLRTYQLMDVIYPAPERAAPTNEKNANWQAQGISSATRTAQGDLFDRAAQFAIDPSRKKDEHHRSQPGVLRRGNETVTPTQVTDGFGRELREGQLALGQKQQETVPSVEAPRKHAPEMTETASEKIRSEKAREMTDRAATKGQISEAAALRASWNKHRRSRGGRD